MQLKSLSIRCGDFLHVSRTYPYVADVAGIGYVFHAEDPYTGIDLDSCYDHSSRVLAPWAQQLVTLLNSYTDISPTGTGVKLWVDASKPGTACEHWNMELYDRKRFFTVTGERLQGTPKRIERRQPETELVYTVMTLVFGTMFSAKNGAQIRQLWYGDWEGAGYPSSFEADMALASYIAFYVGPDPERIANLCLLSGLAYQDKKWAQEDYRRRTIEKVLEGKSEFYTPPRSHTSSPCNETGDEPMPSPDQETPLAFPPDTNSLSNIKKHPREPRERAYRLFLVRENA